VTVELATGPVSWGVDFADAPGNPPWAEVLDGVSRAGYRGIELGPFGYLPVDAARLRDELDARALALTAGFIFEPLHDPGEHDRIVGAARRVAELVAGVDGRTLVVIDAVDAERAAAAGRVECGPEPDEDRWRTIGRTVEAIGAVAETAGLVAAIHPHAGTHIEFADEIARAAELAPLCLDTGHLAYARLDPVQWLRRLDDRVALVHLKDVDPRVLDRGLSLWQAIDAGVFCPLGTGVVDLPNVVEALRGVPWATVEQDRRPGGDPVGDLIASRRALEALGVGAPA
jgi:inosose dehydratase